MLPLNHLCSRPVTPSGWGHVFQSSECLGLMVVGDPSDMQVGSLRPECTGIQTALVQVSNLHPVLTSLSLSFLVDKGEVLLPAPKDPRKANTSVVTNEGPRPPWASCPSAL